ncbi:MAG: histidine--tRNA ligase [Alphaproteobacteria bacterium]|nr:histidine--tRNA ligase [Alphaproteobacteria bacterium]
MFQPVRGTHDLIYNECQSFLRLIEIARQVAKTYNYDEIITPVFEFEGVFKRLGDSTDVVSKEMYTFEDRGGEKITLRPEGTAPVMRSVLSNGLTQSLPLKLFYAGPMFRYDRPQKGRQRQFHQVGIELIGSNEPFSDVECITFSTEFLRALGLLDKCTLKINTLGDFESRERYKETLVLYLTPYENELSEESKKRLHVNPLRILDSKDSKDREIVASAPSYAASLNNASRDYYDAVKQGLSDLDVAFVEDPLLVRGLDYYCHTAFVFETNFLGAQSEILGGGRYDGLSRALGGPDLPGVGWAGGIERLLLLAELKCENNRCVSIIPVGASTDVYARKLALTLRRANISVDMAYAGNVGKRMKRANKINTRFAIIIGDDEVSAQLLSVKDLDSGEIHRVSPETVVDFFNQQSAVHA